MVRSEGLGHLGMGGAPLDTISAGVQPPPAAGDGERRVDDVLPTTTTMLQPSPVQVVVPRHDKQVGMCMCTLVDSRHFQWPGEERSTAS